MRGRVTSQCPCRSHSRRLPSPQDTAPIHWRPALLPPPGSAVCSLAQVWRPESHRTQSQCFWNTASVCLLPAVTHKNKRKSQKGFSFWSPMKKEFRKADQSNAPGYFFCFRPSRYYHCWWYETRLSKRHVATSSLSLQTTWTNWASTKGFKDQTRHSQLILWVSFWKLKGNL